MAPTHYNQKFAATTQLWSGTDEEVLFKTNCTIPENYQKLLRLGWLDTKQLTYQYNSEGFRDQEFDQQPAGIALGCSYAEGTGLHAEQAWPQQLQNLLGQKIWNLGVSGAALDTCYRLIEHWIAQLNVEFVVCTVPPINRYEVFNGSWTNILPSHCIEPWLQAYHKNYLSHDSNSELNRRKDLQAMQYICAKYKVPFYHVLWEQYADGGDARDLQHCGAVVHEQVANKFLQTIRS